MCFLILGVNVLQRFCLYNQHCFPDNTEMPDAMDVIFQTALESGKSGAVSITIFVSLFIFCKPVQYGRTSVYHFHVHEKENKYLH